MTQTLGDDMSATLKTQSLAWLAVVFFVVAGPLMAQTSSHVLEQDYPAKPVRVMTGPTGAISDIIARAVGQRLHERWRQPLVIDNRSGMISAAVTAKAAPDGYTLLVGDRTWRSVAGSVYKELPYNPDKDFAEVTLIAATPSLLLAHPSIPAANMREFIAYLKQQPQAMTYASAGIATVTHLSGEQLKQVTGINLAAVHYKGGGAAMLAILAGEVKMGFNPIAVALPHVKSGKVKAYLITSKKRFAGAPDVPTVIEAGLPELESEYWAGLFAPARTAPKLIRKINQDIVDILNSPSMRTLLLDQGAESVPGTPEEFAAFAKSETSKWARVIKLAGMKSE